MAQAAFHRTSFDLIYARPGQKPADWEDELSRAVTLGARHISAYQLTMEPKTPFYRLHEKGRLRLPDEETSVTLYEMTRDLLAAAGLELYEISNYAAPGAECRHNLLYWRYGEYAGIGPGAHSRLIGPDGNRLAMSATRAPARWLESARDGGICENEELTPAQAGAEYLLMSLRTREGANLPRHAALAGAPLPWDRIEALAAQGLVRQPDETRLIVTDKGRLLLDHVLEQLV